MGLLQDKLGSLIFSLIKVGFFYFSWFFLVKPLLGHLDFKSKTYHPSMNTMSFQDFADCIFRTLEHDLKLMREEEDELLAGQRGSRIAKWIQSTEKRRSDAGLSAPEKLQMPVPNSGEHGRLKRLTGSFMILPCSSFFSIFLHFSWIKKCKND